MYRHRIDQVDVIGGFLSELGFNVIYKIYLVLMTKNIFVKVFA